MHSSASATAFVVLASASSAALRLLQRSVGVFTGAGGRHSIAQCWLLTVDKQGRHGRHRLGKDCPLVHARGWQHRHRAAPATAVWYCPPEKHGVGWVCLQPLCVKCCCLEEAACPVFNIPLILEILSNCCSIGRRAGAAAGSGRWGLLAAAAHCSATVFVNHSLLECSAGVLAKVRPLPLLVKLSLLRCSPGQRRGRPIRSHEHRMAREAIDLSLRLCGNCHLCSCSSLAAALRLHRPHIRNPHHMSPTCQSLLVIPCSIPLDNAYSAWQGNACAYIVPQCSRSALVCT